MKLDPKTSETKNNSIFEIYTVINPIIRMNKKQKFQKRKTEYGRRLQEWMKIEVKNFMLRNGIKTEKEFCEIFQLNNQRYLNGILNKRDRTIPSWFYLHIFHIQAELSKSSQLGDKPYLMDLNFLLTGERDTQAEVDLKRRNRELERRLLISQGRVEELRSVIDKLSETGKAQENS